MNAYLTSFNEEERTDYMIALAHMVGADGEIRSEEVLALRNLCEKFVLGPEARGRVMAATVPGEEILPALDRLKNTELRYSLMLDLCLAAHWDGVVTSEEQEELDQLGERLGLSKEQVAAVLALADKLEDVANFSDELAAAVALGIPKEGLAMAAALKGDKPLG